MIRGKQRILNRQKDIDFEENHMERLVGQFLGVLIQVEVNITVLIKISLIFDGIEISHFDQCLINLVISLID